MLTATLLTSTADPDSAAVAIALEQAILTGSATDETDPPLALGSSAVEAVPPPAAQIKIATAESVRSNKDALQEAADHILCPLTLNISDIPFARQGLYRSCQDVPELRRQVATQGYATGEGNLWLPIVLTVKGPLYGEAIAQSKDGDYQQPIHLSDAQRQPLYRLGQWILSSLAAPPGVYLLQAACKSDSDDGPRVVFDRLWPFPAAPALASLGRQSPDLLVCHWRCLTHQPIRDLQVQP